MNNSQSVRYRQIYDTFISRFYDFGLKIGLTPTGERILRFCVFNTISPYIKRGDNILDLCCGTGTLTIILAKLFYNDCSIIGADLSQGQIAQAQKKNIYPNLKFLVMDANSLRFKDESFDKVIISAALHEMDKNQRLNVLSEVHRVLKKNGYFLIFEHHEPSDTFHRILYNFYLGFWEGLHSYSSETVRSILRELNSADFEIISKTPVKKFYSFFQVILCKK
jgi:ubiquinone/menaquinone biosynthesis C-methylase UbiE